ncbi:MAG: hypothetical protein ABIH92_01625 [Nanoarchaeota archaeon]
MCGIYGAIGFSPSGTEKINLRKSLLRMSSQSRGRDGHGVYDWELGFIGVSRAQPLPEGDVVPLPLIYDNLVMVFNGTLSNDQELTQKYDFPKSVVDTWTAVRLWEKQGWRACEEFVGGFVFGVFDKSSQILTVAKNFKTLWYIRSLDYFMFASE